MAKRLWRALLLTVLALAPVKAFAQAADAAGSLELVDPQVFRACGDPRNMPFSNENGEGFENKLAGLLAEKLGKKLGYTYYPQATGFVRNTLGSHRCDVIMGFPQGDDLAQVTIPYYRTTYALVFKPGSGLDAVTALDDPRLRDKRIGIVAGTPPSTNMAINGLMAHAKPYPLMIDTRIDSSARAMIDDLERGDIDCGILWGPLAGYYASQSKPPLIVSPLLKETLGPPLIYRIGMAVRPSDQEFKRTLNKLIAENQSEINKVLIGYGVPLLDEGGGRRSPRTRCPSGRDTDSGRDRAGASGRRPRGGRGRRIRAGAGGLSATRLSGADASDAARRESARQRRSDRSLAAPGGCVRRCAAASAAPARFTRGVLSGATGPGRTFRAAFGCRTLDMANSPRPCSNIFPAAWIESPMAIARDNSFSIVWPTAGCRGTPQNARFRLVTTRSVGIEREPMVGPRPACRWNEPRRSRVPSRQGVASAASWMTRPSSNRRFSIRTGTSQT